MYQIIGEKISVSGVYAMGKFHPKKFQWREQVLPISSIHSVHDFKDGTVRRRVFSVTAANNVYLLDFNRDTEIWQLQQIWVEE